MPKQRNDFDCGVYTILFMKHLLHTNQVNSKEVPEEYVVPMDAMNLDGFRVLLLEEIKAEAPGAFA